MALEFFFCFFFLNSHIPESKTVNERRAFKTVLAGKEANEIPGSE